jgi:hypothetical protein
LVLCDGDGCCGKLQGKALEQDVSGKNVAVSNTLEIEVYTKDKITTDKIFTPCCH